MSPKDAFTKKTRKRYKALRRITRGREVWGHTLIPGVRRATADTPEHVYLEVRRRYWNGSHESRYFTFDSMPVEHEVNQIISIMTKGEWA